MGDAINLFSSGVLSSYLIFIWNMATGPSVPYTVEFFRTSGSSDLHSRSNPLSFHAFERLYDFHSTCRFILVPSPFQTMNISLMENFCREVPMVFSTDIRFSLSLI